MSEDGHDGHRTGGQAHPEILKGSRPVPCCAVSVEGGGCSGFQYKFDIDRERAADDMVIERKAAWC